MTNGLQEEFRFEEKKSIRRRMGDYLVITIGAFVYSTAVSLFLDPNRLAPGGVTGIAIMLSKYTGMETGTWVLLINLPILAIGMWKFGLRFLLSTLYCTAMTSLFINVLSPIGAVTVDPLLASLAGGALMAIGIGLVFKAGATSGGTDILVKLLRLKFPYLKTGALFLLTDACIVALSGVVFQDVDVALYAGLVVVVNSLLLDVVLYGRDEAKLLVIISDCHEAIARRLLEEMDIGVTFLEGSGAYSGKDKRVILCAIKKHVSHRAEEIVRQEDPAVFMIVTSATEIYGEGYKSLFSEKI